MFISNREVSELNTKMVFIAGVTE